MPIFVVNFIPSNMIPIHFAPLQGFTDYIYRKTHNEVFGGIETYYSPFVRIEKGDFRRKEVRDIEPDNNIPDKFIPQLIASVPEEMEKITDMLMDKGYRKIDINLGCPFPVLAKKHKGSGILPYPEEVYRLLDTVHRYKEISFSIKMRLGWESAQESLNLLPFLNELPVSHITIHPRLGKQQYKGTVDMDGFTHFYNGCTIPLIYNGDILSVEEIQNITKKYPNLTGVMIGRGLLANPAMALEYKNEKGLSVEEKNSKLRIFHQQLLSDYSSVMEGGENQILQKMKTLWEYLLPEADKKLKKKIFKSKSLSSYNEEVHKLLQ